MEFLIVWSIVAIIIAIVGVFFAGYNEEDCAQRRSEAVGYTVFAAICWPVIFILFMIASPLLGIYYLGRYIKNRR